MNQQIFLYTSASVGAIAVISVVYIFVRHQTFKLPGFGLLIAGTILVGLPAWNTWKLSWTKDGFNMQFDTLKQSVSNLDSKMSTNLVALTKSTEKTDNELKAIAANISSVRATSSFLLAEQFLPSYRGSDLPVWTGHSAWVAGDNHAFSKPPMWRVLSNEYIFTPAMKDALWRAETIAVRAQKEIATNSPTLQTPK